MKVTISKVPTRDKWIVSMQFGDYLGAVVVNGQSYEAVEIQLKHRQTGEVMKPLTGSYERHRH